MDGDTHDVQHDRDDDDQEEEDHHTPPSVGRAARIRHITDRPLQLAPAQISRPGSAADPKAAGRYGDPDTADQGGPMPRGRQPAHTTLTEALRTRIAAGEWPPGERLPSRAALAAEYRLGDAVVQRAQETLIREGLLDGRAGSGTYLAQDRPRHQLRLDADAEFAVRPGAAGHWALLCRREGPVTFAYFVQDRPLLLARTGAGGVGSTGYRVRAATADSADAQILGLLKREAVTLLDHLGGGQEAGQVVVPGRYWDLLLP